MKKVKSVVVLIEPMPFFTLDTHKQGSELGSMYSWFDQ